jgi:hypothetical protein
MIMVGSTLRIAAGALWLLTLAVMLRRYSQVRGTTLTEPWSWVCLACGLLALAQFYQLSASDSWSSRVLDHAAVGAGLCPIVAIFGAKRPQARYWSFIVASLWIVLMLPAMEAALVGTTVPDTMGLRAAFYWLLIACALINYGATRFAVPALLATLAQSLLVADLLGLLPPAFEGGGSLLAASCGCLATLLVRPRPATPAAGAADLIWLNFRDAYGAVWALRVAQRMNAMAEQRNWNARIDWSGVQGNQQFVRTLTILLRSFLSPAWTALPHHSFDS